MMREAGVEPKVVEYLKEPPSATRLKQLLKAAGVGVRRRCARRTDLRRARPGRPEVVGRQAARSHGRKPDPQSSGPIVETAKGVRLCRPAELVREIL
jgi:arsenate reductase